MSKHISYIVPVEYMTGNISGRQELDYVQGGDGAYAAPDGQKTSATNYDPRLIAKRKRPNGPDDGCLYFQVRTKTSVNMTAAMRLNMAAMGGAGALFASLLRNKTAQIYAQCAAATPKGSTMRAFIVPLLIAGLTAKEARITIANNVYIVNPWISEDVPNVPIPLDILNKFAGVLSASPYNATTTEYLQNTYTAYWYDIAAYGHAHPELVPFIEEDHDVICSLVNVGVTRYLVGDGESYIDTGVKALPNTYTQVKVKYNNATTNMYMFGARTNSTDLSHTYYIAYNEIWGTGKQLRVYNGSSVNVEYIFTNGTHIVTLQAGSCQIDSDTFPCGTNEGTLYTLFVMAWSNAGQRGGTAMNGQGMAFCDMRNTDGGDLYLVPFIRNSAPGMLDILTGTFYQNAGTGAFTIEKTTNS